VTVDYDRASGGLKFSVKTRTDGKREGEADSRKSTAAA